MITDIHEIEKLYAEVITETKANSKHGVPKPKSILEITKPFFELVKDKFYKDYEDGMSLKNVAIALNKLGLKTGHYPYIYEIHVPTAYKNARGLNMPFDDGMSLKGRESQESVLDELRRLLPTVEEKNKAKVRLKKYSSKEDQDTQPDGNKTFTRLEMRAFKITNSIVKKLFIEQGFILREKDMNKSDKLSLLS